MTNWLYTLSIVSVAHGVEDHSLPIVSIPKEPDTDNTSGAEKWKEDHKWLLNMLRKVTKGRQWGIK